MKHPISFGPQQFVLPANAENGDQLGEVKFASTFVKTWNYHEGTDLDESDFTFMKIAGPSNFSVDFLTGMITVDNLIFSMHHMMEVMEQVTGLETGHF